MKRISLCIATALLLLLGAAPANACSCLPPPPPAEAIEEADAVLLGRVVETQRTGDNINEGELIATVAVEKSWKGPGGEVAVHTPPNSAQCGLGFSEGERWVIYASKRDGVLHAHLCTRSTTGDPVQEEIDALNSVTGFGGDSDGGCGGPLAASGQALGLVGLAAMLRRRRA